MIIYQNQSNRPTAHHKCGARNLNVAFTHSETSVPTNGGVGDEDEVICVAALLPLRVPPPPMMTETCIQQNHTLTIHTTTSMISGMPHVRKSLASSLIVALL